MKNLFKAISIALVLGLLCLINPSADIKANDETIAVNDQLIVFKINDKNYYTQTIGSEDIAVKQMDTAPIIHLDRTFVPVRFLGNALGVDDSNIEWNNTTRTATLKGSNKLDLVIGKKAIVVNDKTEPIDVAPMITNSRTMLPARFVAEGLGFTVDWDADNQLVIVYQGERPDISAIIAKIKGEKVDGNLKLLPTTGLPDAKGKGYPFPNYATTIPFTSKNGTEVVALEYRDGDIKIVMTKNPVEMMQLYTDFGGGAVTGINGKDYYQVPRGYESVIGVKDINNYKQFDTLKLFIPKDGLYEFPNPFK